MTTRRENQRAQAPGQPRRADARGVPARDWASLQSSIDGRLLRPQDAAYDAASLWPVATADDRRPVAVAQCISPTDVVAAVRFATSAGIDLAVRGGGHSFAGHSRTDGLLIDTAALSGIRVDGATARVGAGVRLGGVYDGLHECGRAIPAGCGPTVGIAGLALGGGLGVLGRSHGLTSDALIGVDVVLADGTVIASGPDHDADLFWAMRGAGAGNFGVVTELHFATIPEPQASAFHVGFPSESAAALIGAWQHWLLDAPDEIAPELQLSIPAVVDLPAQPRLLGAVTGDEAQRDSHLHQLLRSLEVVPQLQQVHGGSLCDVKKHLAHVGDSLEKESGATATGLNRSRSLFVGSALPAHVVEELVALTTGNRAPGETRELGLTPMGGAYNRMAPYETAFVHRDDLFLLKYSVTIGRAADPTHAREWLDAATAIVAPHATGRAYQNFADPELADPLASYYGQNLDRLIGIKGAYDPEDVFRHAQSIPPRV